MASPGGPGPPLARIPDDPSRTRAPSPSVKRRLENVGDASVSTYSDRDELILLRALLQDRDAQLNRYEMNASDAETGWCYARRETEEVREVAGQHVQRLASYTLLEQEAAQQAVQQLEQAEKGARTLALEAHEVFSRYSYALENAARQGQVVRAEHANVEMVFSEYVSGLNDAAVEVKAQREFTHSLESQCWKLAQDHGQIEGLESRCMAKPSGCIR